MGSSGSSSGGYIDYIMKFAAKELFNIDLLLAEIEFGSNNVKLVQGKNQDIQDIILLNDQGDILLKFAKVYGFRNIQNLVRKLNLDQKSKSKSGYHFVEVMACPSGCINGGGQLKQMDSKWSSSETSSNSLSRQFVAISESKYRSIKTQGPLENLAVLDLYR